MYRNSYALKVMGHIVIAVSQKSKLIAKGAMRNFFSLLLE